MYYPEELIRQIREKSDIVNVISRYVSLTRKGRNYFGLCPFHGEKTPSFSVNPAEQFYHCFGCGVGGNVFTFLQNMENISFVEAVQQLAEEAHIPLPEMELSPKEKARIARRERMYEANRDAARFFYVQLVKSPYGAAAREYLAGRQVSEAYLKKFGLGYAPISRDALSRYLMSKGYEPELLRAACLMGGDASRVYDRFFNRVMFPIFDIRGRVIAFGGRVIGKGEPKYLNSSDTELFNKRKNLYAMNLAKKSRRKQALMVEGYMDVFSLHQAGFDNAVASLGTALTPEQALLLKRYFEEVCLVYDSDTAGTNAARRAIPILEDAGLRVRVMRVPGAKDPDEFIKANGAQAFEELIEKAMDPVDFELAISDTHTLEGQIETMKKMRNRLMRIQDDGERELHIRDVAARLGISQETLAKQVEEERRNFGTQEYRQARQVMIRGNRNTHTDGLEQTQVQLLALLLQYPDSRTQLFSQVSPTDFPEKTPEKEGKESEENIFRRAAQYIFDKRQERIVSADLISLARDEEEQKKLTRIVTEELPKTREELEKLAVETIRRLRQVALDEQLRGARQAEELQQIIQQKKQLEKLEIHL
ncbi:MAG TPA: DNA primase [Candidatus Faecimorpha stercoravium]|nr:DNA primase [Candidatus Faecimorpha stercoravium]